MANRSTRLRGARGGRRGTTMRGSRGASYGLRRPPPGSRGQVARSYRPVRGGPAGGGVRRKPGRWPLLAALLAAAALAVIIVLTVRAHGHGCPSAQDRIIWADQETAEEGNSASPPPGLVDRAEALASCGGGQLDLLAGAGEGGVQVGPAVSLSVYREPGELENDPTTRLLDVHRLIANALRRAQAARVPGDGRDLIGLLNSVSAELGGARNDVWLSTLGLPTVAPADARALMAAEPAQAVAAIARYLPSLPGARVHLILSPPAGDQPRLNTATDAWRRAFMIALLHRAGADVVSVQEIESIESPAPGAPPAPAVPNLPEPTPPITPRPKPGTPYRVTLDSAAFFLPNSTQFVTGERQVLAGLQPVIRAWRTGDYLRVTVVGHCAMFGPPEGALALSRARAMLIAAMLRRSGVSNITATGVGYGQPLPPSPQSASNRVVVVTVYPKN